MFYLFISLASLIIIALVLWFSTAKQRNYPTSLIQRRRDAEQSEPHKNDSNSGWDSFSPETKRQIIEGYQRQAAGGHSNTNSSKS